MLLSTLSERMSFLVGMFSLLHYYRWGLSWLVTEWYLGGWTKKGCVNCCSYVSGDLAAWVNGNDARR